ncbi:hypothetical protein BDY17DRAFT_189902 [Neohortaea acidophila]|uniref:Chitin-binding type-1 domain-containing protein n=1 Tax=Neohortaea acidophila TaxID=245834 RepID=A0A6A6PNE0_9PEZI|nr:uncharacterized protein BDY17DRAFT_189902 [Neohortaea acidophila]KAF2481522.1 hypothetical protein BDY17DRAFT_189902 [Neohortaea acidophila]
MVNWRNGVATLLAGLATFDIALADIVTVFAYPSTCSAIYTSKSRPQHTKTVHHTITVTPSPAPDHGHNHGTPFLLEVQTSSGNTRKRNANIPMYVRANGFTTRSTETAGHYIIQNGMLTTVHGGYISEPVGVRHNSFAIKGHLQSENSTFHVRDGLLEWKNDNFTNGIAHFYEIFPAGRARAGEILAYFYGPLFKDWTPVVLVVRPVTTTDVSSTSSTSSSSATISTPGLPLGTGHGTTIISSKSTGMYQNRSTTSVSGPAGSPTSLVVTPNGQCGGVTGYTCTGGNFGPCCSKYGFCGTGDNYCSERVGCDPEFGTCFSNSTSTSTSVTMTTTASSMQVTNTSPPTFTCPTDNGQVLTDNNGVQYNISCNAEITSMAYNSIAVPNSFDQCFALCDAQPHCTAFSYAGGADGVGAGICSFQNSTNPHITRDVPGFVAAIRVSKFYNTSSMPTSTFTSPNGPIGPNNPITVNNTLPANSTATSTATSTTTSPAAPPCPTSSAALCGSNSTSPNTTSTTCSSAGGNTYNTTCGVEYSGTTINTTGIVGLPPQKRAIEYTLGDCQTLCDRYKACVAFNYNHTSDECTLLSTVTSQKKAPGAIAAAVPPQDLAQKTNPPTTTTTPMSTMGSTVTSTVSSGVIKPVSTPSSSSSMTMSTPISTTSTTSSTTSSSSSASSSVSSTSSHSSSSTTTSTSSSSTASPTSTSTSTTSSTTSSTTASGTPSTFDPMCPAANGTGFTDTAGNLYEVLCNTNFEPGAFNDSSFATLGACIDACHEQSAGSDGPCVAVSYTDGPCYFHFGFTDQTNDTGVDAAVLASYIKATPATYTPASSTSTSTSTTATSSSISSSSSSVTSAPTSSSSASTTSTSSSSTRTGYLVLASPTPCSFDDPAGSDEDDNYCPITLPFAMQIYSKSSMTTYASTNGYISILSGSSQYSVQKFPANNIPNNTVAPFFDDMYLRGNSTPQDGIFYEIPASGDSVTYEYYLNRGTTQGTVNASETFHFTVSYNITTPGVFLYTYYQTGGASDSGIYAAVGMQGGEYSPVLPMGCQANLMNSQLCRHGSGVYVFIPDCRYHAWAGGELQYADEQV